ncbi:SPL family radical SAM protein [Marinicrinis lubricantis]|uniref:Radical SAM protein n=1 Tax=Marinicrinis lubricantis TaxID=2086470 RepID=A0ABW1IVN3_9BACL
MAKTYESITTKQTMTRVKEERMPFDWSINPYRGCAHGCSFCYARGFQAFIQHGADDEFQNHIMMKMNAAEALEAQLAKLAARFKYDIDAVGRYVGAVAIGTATDPYQPVEGKSKLTRECLKVLAKYRIRTSITTRSPLILRDLDLITVMPPHISVNISMNTLDAKLTRTLEPGSPLPAKRLETIEQLVQHGVDTTLFLAPILPFLTDSEEQLEAVFEAARKSGASSVMTSVLRLSPDVKKGYYNMLKQHFPDKLPGYYRLYSGAYSTKAYQESIHRLTDELRRKYAFGVESLKEEEIKKINPCDDENTVSLEQLAGGLPLEQLSFSF